MVKSLAFSPSYILTSETKILNSVDVGEPSRGIWLTYPYPSKDKLENNIILIRMIIANRA